MSVFTPDVGAVGQCRLSWPSPPPPREACFSKMRLLLEFVKSPAVVWGVFMLKVILQLVRSEVVHKASQPGRRPPPSFHPSSGSLFRAVPWLPETPYLGKSEQVLQAWNRLLGAPHLCHLGHPPKPRSPGTQTALSPHCSPGSWRQPPPLDTVRLNVFQHYLNVLIVMFISLKR